MHRIEQTAIRIPSDLKALAERLAGASGMSLNAYVIALLEREIAALTPEERSFFESLSQRLKQQSAAHLLNENAQEYQAPKAQSRARAKKQARQ